MIVTLKKCKLIILVIILTITSICFSNSTQAQTYTGTGGTIYDDSLTIFSQQVTGLTQNKLSPNYGLASIELNILHPYLQNLVVDLMAPDGTYTNLVRHRGGNGDNFTNTIFTDTASLSIQTISNSYAPYTGYFKAISYLGSINNYQNGNGTWKLFVTDDSPNNIGSVINWKLNFDANVTGITDTFSSNIPIIYVNTFLNTTNADSSIKGSIKVINNNGITRNYAKDSVFEFFGNMKIKERGHYSLNFPQLSYSIELNDENGNDTSVSLLGMPKESDWILMNTWNDRSFVRNPLMYHLFNKMGHYATRFQYCEVFLNGEYWGIYQLTEKIKRDKNRVDIAKLKATDLAGDSLTGGYIFKHDYTTDTLGWLSDVAPDACPTNFARFQNVYPNYDDIKPEQQTYLKTYIDTIEKKLFSGNFTDTINNYRKYIDVNSFADYLLCNEFAWNGDGFAKSMYFHKDRDSKSEKLFAGPIWDFDWSLKKMPWISDSIKVWSYTTSTCNNLQATLPWYDIMMKDEYFRNLVRCRYENYRTTIFSTAYISNTIDSLESILDEAQVRHYTKWPTWGVSTGTPEKQPYSANMEQELDTLKAMIGRRLIWLDLKLPGNCYPLATSNVNEIIPSINIFPNPADNNFTLQFDAKKLEEINIRLTDITGKIVQEKYIKSKKGFNSFTFETSSLKNGMYFLEMKYNNKTEAHKIMISH